jgi:hypothetical protein
MLRARVLRLISSLALVAARGLQDGKLYLLDFGRLYPPESPLLAAHIFPPVPHERAVFFKMLRPGACTIP